MAHETLATGHHTDGCPYGDAPTRELEPRQLDRRRVAPESVVNIALAGLIADEYEIVADETSTNIKQGLGTERPDVVPGAAPDTTREKEPTMPIWHVHYPKGVYDAQDRQAFAGKVTDLYVERALPRFYVSVVFHELVPDEFFVGGEPAERFVRISIDQIALQTPDPERRKQWMNVVNRWMAPFLEERGLHSEIHIDNTPREFWTIDGIFPPPAGSADERRWIEENKPSPLIGEPI
jgi:phenylpyruvate tautomerase PptA (4-oxalocrotonate tautomerase family)